MDVVAVVENVNTLNVENNNETIDRLYGQAIIDEAQAEMLRTSLNDDGLKEAALDVLQKLDAEFWRQESLKKAHENAQKIAALRAMLPVEERQEKRGRKAASGTSRKFDENYTDAYWPQSQGGGNETGKAHAFARATAASVLGFLSWPDFINDEQRKVFVKCSRFEAWRLLGEIMQSRGYAQREFSSFCNGWKAPWR